MAAQKTAVQNEKHTQAQKNSFKQVRQQDAYLAIRPAYPRGCCPQAAKRIKKLHTLLVSLYF